ncbi:hypothetical protein [Terrihalobacillus insolitus]|uniref:hypothetical protein n=1 Tax=Terrihalobacillus insolitus TaxID=2950438 RepID=UPI002342443F|nr:hypothetical protein [Terrihalobacillus insolitus]MDC3412504.1 hypothetical protein [Terrihalobacillus insolitus]
MRKELDLKTKGVSFNLLDQDQKELYDHAMKKSNFSGYVKRLMIRDMLGNHATKEFNRNLRVREK